ncbi:MAG: hypothetical protein A2073_07985 [Deltaproteobacteria bacterium GWC2_42_11]|nr:MAG: hypothetical protein A2073_07985 [Deltaproteobacteria bacterium GWC2_42_11]
MKNKITIFIILMATLVAWWVLPTNQRGKHTVGIALPVSLLTIKEAYAGDFDRLQKELNDYSGSEYMRENLIKPVPAGLEQGGKSPHIEVKDEGVKELKTVAKQLSARKVNEKNRIDLTLIKNRLFEPDKDLWERLDNMEDFSKLLLEDYTLKTVLAVGIKNNLEIQSSYKSALAAVERYDQVSNLDEILNQYAVFTKNLDLNIGEPMMSNKPVIMNFPFPGMLSLKGNIVERDIETARLELEKSVQDMVVMIKETYYKTAYLYDAVKITNDVLGILHRMKDAVNAVYVTGKVSMNDIIKIQMEIDKMETELASFKEERKTVQVKLNKLLNIREDFMPEKVEELKPVVLTYVKENLFKKGVSERNEIKKLTKEIDRMRLMIEMAEKQFYPDFTPGFSIFQNRIIKQVGTSAEEMPFSDMPMVRGGNWFGRNDAYIRETKFKYQAMNKMLDGLKNMTISEINDAVYRYENAGRFYKLYESKLVPKSELTVDIAGALYVNRKIDFMDLITSQELFLKYSLMLKESVKNMNIEAVKIERLAGGELEARVMGQGSGVREKKEEKGK